MQLDDFNMCLRSLTYSLELSAQLQDTSRDSDVLGEMADIYTEMGDLEKAGQVGCRHLCNCHAYLHCVRTQRCHPDVGAYRHRFAHDRKTCTAFLIVALAGTAICSIASLICDKLLCVCVAVL